MRQVLVIHGWSDDSGSFKPLGEKLRSAGFDALDVWLADYVSMDDDVTVTDASKRMEEVVGALVAAGKISVPFDMVVHSTGGLVARNWLVMFDCARKARWLKRLVMLAPANYGSALAAKGKSFIGRVTKGISNGFSTGTQMLNALELGSPFQWGLALSDVLGTEGLAETGAKPAYGEDACMPFVLSGIRGYDGILMKIVNEDGADGTVRAAAANLSAYGATLDFSVDDADPTFSAWTPRDALAPYAYRALIDENHSTIVRTLGADTFALIVQALQCKDGAGYRAIQQEWAAATDALEVADDSARHRFFMLNTFVVDDLGNPVDDHFIEFFGPDHESNSAPMLFFHDKVIRDVHQNLVQKACRCFYLDRTALMSGFYERIAGNAKKELLLSITAAPPGSNTRYFRSTEAGADGSFRLHLFDDKNPEERWLKRYSTHFLKIIIPRRPNANVFRLTQLPA